MTEKQTKIIVTLGPATNTEQDLRKIKAREVDFVRVNMSHSSLEDLEYFIDLSRKVGIQFIIDTEGSQIRTGDLQQNTIQFKENERVELHANPIAGDSTKLALKPGYVIEQLDVGDLIHIDFDTLILRITDVSTVSDGYVTARTITGGLRLSGIATAAPCTSIGISTLTGPVGGVSATCTARCSTPSASPADGIRK